MKFEVKKYFSGLCTYNVEADTKEKAYSKVAEIPINYSEVMETLEAWEDCDEVEEI